MKANLNGKVSRIHLIVFILFIYFDARDWTQDLTCAKHVLSQSYTTSLYSTLSGKK
jgi:hypothetical protein